ncbi:hypothetical protein QZH41_011652, partial [Actinostola sp. cb2023]
FQKPEHSRVINVKSMSRINIICPNPAMNVDVVQDNTPKEWLYENLWIVSKNSYDNCNASSPKTDRLLLRCDTPLMLKYHTLIFLQYSVTMQGLEFPVGKEYYFIATSDGTKASLNSRAGGNCARGSMKIKFYVCKGPGGSQPSWNVVIPLLVVIFILVIMNSFVICRLRQGSPKSCLNEDNLNNVSRSSSYHLKNNNRKNSSPVMV